MLSSRYTLWSALLALLLCSPLVWATPDAVGLSPECSVCGPDGDGEKPVRLELVWRGAPGQVTVYRSNKVEAGNLLFDGDLNPGDTFVIDAAAKGEKDLGSKVGFYLDGAFVAEVHTSCSDVLGVGTTEANQEKGKDPNGAVDVEVMGGVGKDGAAYCDIPPPPPPGLECVECGFGGDDANKVSELTLRYLGPGGLVTIYNDNKVEASQRLFEGVLNTGDEVTIKASTVGRNEFRSKVGFYVDGTFVAEIHTSCSSPIGFGTTEANQEKGKDPNGVADFMVISGLDKDGAAFCDIPPPPPPGLECVECGYGAFDGAKAAMLTLRYSGAPGRVTVYRSNKVEDGNLLFDGDLNPGDTFVIDAATLGERDLGAKVGFYLDGEFIAEIHTSCSDVLTVGTTEANQVKGKDPNGVVDVTVTAGRDKNGGIYCGEEPCPDAGPPTIEYSVVEEDGTRYIEVRITDDTALESVSFEEVGSNNLEEVVSARVFTPGEPTAFFKFRITDITQNSALRGQATDQCGSTLCPSDPVNGIPSLTAKRLVIDDDVAGRYELSSNFPNTQAAKDAGYDRFGFLVEGADDNGIIQYETLALNNMKVYEQPVAGCDADAGCVLDPPQTALTVVMSSVIAANPASFGFAVADECNIFVLDPAVSGIARVGSSGGGHVLSCPAFVDASLAAEAVFGMEQNQPNPFSGRSTIQFTMPEAGDVYLAVYDPLGRTIQVLADGTYEKGSYSVSIDATSIPSGTYLYRLTTPHGTVVRQMVVVR